MAELENTILQIKDQYKYQGSKKYFFEETKKIPPGNLSRAELVYFPRKPFMEVRMESFDFGEGASSSKAFFRAIVLASFSDLAEIK